MCESVSADQLQNGGNVTEVVNLVQIIETQREDRAHLPYLHWDSTDPGAHSQLEAHLWGHDQGIMQRVTDGHTVVTGHHCQEETLSGSEDKDKAHLGSTVQHRNASVLSPKVHQNPKESDGHITDFQEGKVCQEEVHGFVQGRLKNMYYYYKTVSIKDNDVNDGEHPQIIALEGLEGQKTLGVQIVSLWTCFLLLPSLHISSVGTIQSKVLLFHFLWLLFPYI